MHVWVGGLGCCAVAAAANALPYLACCPWHGRCCGGGLFTDGSICWYGATMLLLPQGAGPNQAAQLGLAPRPPQALPRAAVHIRRGCAPACLPACMQYITVHCGACMQGQPAPAVMWLGRPPSQCHACRCGGPITLSYETFTHPTACRPTCPACRGQPRGVLRALCVEPGGGAGRHPLEALRHHPLHPYRCACWTVHSLACCAHRLRETEHITLIWLAP
jgi:hypothetical protein